MGVPPPPDAPDLPEQNSIAISASFETPPIGIEICGFPIAIPPFGFNLSFVFPFPDFEFPPPFPFFLPAICDLVNAIAKPYGGGRVGTPGLDDDPEFGPS